ncbi:GNAT family N-acetyltransferase [bacterium]|nr:GNAT family N-acetyltransferase [bacterium]
MDKSQLGVISLKNFDLNSLNNFTCGDKSLDRFIRDEATSFEKNLFSSTWIVIHENYGVIGYFSLCNSSLELQEQERMVLDLDASKNKLRAPSILLTKLAVSKKLHGKNLGSTIIKIVTEMAAKYSALMSARLLIVDAVNDKAGFYEKCNFEYCVNNKKDNKTAKMYLDLLHI